MGVLSIVLQLILSLSILVVLHECGHFFPAKWFKTRVEKFYLFFNPYFSLFKIQKGETEYGIGWVPFGGYVKISGMIDESMDTEQMAGEPQPWEFRSKPAWQRLIIMVGGVLVNFVLGFLIFAGMLWHWGESYIPSINVTDGIFITDSLGYEIGLQNGDKIIQVGDVPFEKFNPGAFNMGIIINDARSFVVERNGEQVILPIGEQYTKILTKKYKKKTLFTARFPQKVYQVNDESPAFTAGLQVDDEVVQVNSIATPSFKEFATEIKKYKSETVSILVKRDDQLVTMNITPDAEGIIGMQSAPMADFYDITNVKYGFLESFPAGVNKGVGFLKDQLKAFGQIADDRIDATDSLGSIVSIARMFDSGWDWHRFWQITAMLSILLGFFNILPIPALDGGYVMFLLYEIISGRKPSDKFMEYATLFGFILMICLMIFALGLDVTNIFNGN